MDKILGINSKFMNTMNRIADFLLLNGLFLITSIPVITIGASTTALYSVMQKVVSNEEGYIIQSYFQAFRKNFRRATIIWGILLIVGVLLGVDIYFYFGARENEIPFMVKYLCYFCFICYTFTLDYVFIVLGKECETVKRTIISAFLLAIKYLPYTIVITLLNLSGFLLILAFPYTLPYVVLVVLFMGFSGVAYFNSKIFNKIFYKEKELMQNETIKD